MNYNLYDVDVEKKQQRIRNRAVYYRAAADSIAEVKKVFRAYDGKVYNKNFDIAIFDIYTNNENLHMYVKHDFGRIAIEFTQGFNYNDTIEIFSACDCIADNPVRSWDDKEELKIFDEKRHINADKAESLLSKKYDELIKEADTADKEADTLPETLKEIQETVNNLARLKDSISYHFWQICGIDRIELR